MKKISAVILAASLGVAVQAQLVDSFINTSLSPYTQTIVLAQNGDGPLNFSTTANGLQVSRTYTSGGTPQQDLLLRGDYSLSVGDTLRVSVANLASGGAYADFGIAIASQVNPIAAVWAGSNVDTRSNMLAVYVKPASSEIGASGFNGTTSVVGTHNTVGSFTSIDGLWITETAANVYSLGYSLSGVDVTYKSGLTFTGADIGSAIGVYGDLRATTTSPANLVDLTIVPVPEPTTLAIGGFGALGLLLAARRKK
jgi:hypothetical protein